MRAVFSCPANGMAAKGGNFDVCLDVDACSCTQEWGWKGWGVAVQTPLD